MKSVFCVMFLTLITGLTFGQAKPHDDFKFYKSYQDYKDHKPVADLMVNRVEKKRVEIYDNGNFKLVKASKLPAAFFTDVNGNLLRAYGNNLYYIFVEGPLCFYARKSQVQMEYVGSGSFYVFGYGEEDTNVIISDYYSETINGKIMRLSDETLDLYLAKYNLKTQFDFDALDIEKGDNFYDKKSKKINKIAKYVKIINEKME